MAGNEIHHNLLPTTNISKSKSRSTCCRCFLEPIIPTLPQSPHPNLINQDLAPVDPRSRILSSIDLTYLWLGLVVSVPNYYLAGSLVELGMAWWQGIGTVLLANVITYVILVLTAHPGTKYGLSFPVILRASFGVYGANIPAVLRALVACGWYGIETWIGGQAVYQLLDVILHRKLSALALRLPLLGTSVPELGCFLLFWVIQVWFVWNGMESIKQLEKFSAPVLVLLTGSLLVWAYVSAGGFGRMLSTPSAFARGGAQEGKFWQVFFPALTANVGAWATLSLNIPDFTRYTHSQLDQVLGQASLPFFMASFAFIGLAVTSSTEVIFGRIISNPIELLPAIGGVLPALISLVGITVATLTTNVAANVVAPANAVISLNPTLFSFRTAGFMVTILSVLFLPWKLLQDSHGFIYTWLVGYSALLGPVSGILLCDYYILRNRVLDIEGLYTGSKTGSYWYTSGVNLSAVAALVLGVAPSIPGFLQVCGVALRVPKVLLAVYDGAWFAGFLIAALVYFVLSKSSTRTKRGTQDR